MKREEIKEIVLRKLDEVLTIKEGNIYAQTVPTLRKWAKKLEYVGAWKAKKSDLISFLEEVIEVEESLSFDSNNQEEVKGIDEVENEVLPEEKDLSKSDIKVAKDESTKAKDEVASDKNKDDNKSNMTTMVVLNDHVKTYRYRYLITILANQRGISLTNGENKTIVAHGAIDELSKLAVDFGTYMDLINKVRVSEWKQAKKNDVLVENLERSLILGMLHQLKENESEKIRNSKVEATVKRNITKEKVVMDWYNKGRQIIINLDKDQPKN